EQNKRTAQSSVKNTDHRGFSSRGAQYSPPGEGPTPYLPDWCVDQSASPSGCWFTEGWVPPRSEEVYSEVRVWVARSPFRESSEGSMISRSSRRGRTPHRTGKFNITAQEQNSSLVIPATNPNDYTVPSPFRSTSDSEDEEVIPDSQAIHSQTACSRRRGSFNLTVPESMLEHLRLQRSQQADRQSRGNRSDHHSGISLADQHSDQLDQYDGHQGGEEGFDRSRQEMFEEGNQYDDQMAYRNDNDDVDDDDERTEYTSRLENRESDHYVRQEMYDRDDGQYREKSGHDESESLREHRGDGLKILPEGGMYMLSMKVSESSMEEDYRNMSHVSASSRSDMSNIGMAEVENGTYVGRDESASRSCRSLSNMEMADAESGMYVDRDDGGNRSRRSLSNMEMTDAESRMYVGRDESASRSHRSVSNMEMTDAETGMYLNKDESTSRSYRSLSRSRDDLAASRSDISRRRQSSFSAVSPEVDTMTRHLSISVDLERSMKARDQERMGRYSEGHKSRFGSPSRSEKDLRLSDGHLHGKGSPFDMQRLNSSYEHQNQENQSRSASRNDMYQSPRSLLSGRRSPSIASTPRVQEDWESCSERGDGNSPLKAVTPSPVVSPRGASPASSSHRSQRSARMSRVSDGSRSGSVSGGSMMSSRSQQSQQSPRIRSQGGRTPLRSLTLPQSESQTRSGTLQSQRSTPVLLRSSPRLQGSPSASLRSTSRSMQRSSPRTPGSNKGTPKSEKSVLGSSTRRMGLSQASPVIAGKRQGSAEVDALPHQTMLFSPPIASTQNIGALSRLSPQPSTSRQSRITDFVQQAEGENTNITSTAAEITKKVVRKPRQKSRYLIPTTTVRKHFNHFAGMRVAKDAIEEVMKVSETYWDNLCADLEAYARHAGRKRIQMADFELLFKRQGYVTEKTSLNSLIRRYLPWEEADKLIPVIGADNKIYPKLHWGGQQDIPKTVDCYHRPCGSILMASPPRYFVGYSRYCLHSICTSLTWECENNIQRLLVKKTYFQDGATAMEIRGRPRYALLHTSPCRNIPLVHRDVTGSQFRFYGLKSGFHQLTIGLKCSQRVLILGLDLLDVVEQLLLAPVQLSKFISNDKFFSHISDVVNFTAAMVKYDTVATAKVSVGRAIKLDHLLRMIQASTFL
ncbi:CENPT-like protein, partial [Mya arenaria]